MEPLPSSEQPRSLLLAHRLAPCWSGQLRGPPCAVDGGMRRDRGGEGRLNGLRCLSLAQSVRHLTVSAQSLLHCLGCEAVSLPWLSFPPSLPPPFLSVSHTLYSLPLSRAVSPSSSCTDFPCVTREERAPVVSEVSTIVISRRHTETSERLNEQTRRPTRRRPRRGRREARGPRRTVPVQSPALHARASLAQCRGA